MIFHATGNSLTDKQHYSQIINGKQISDIFGEAHKRVKRSARTDKKLYIDNLASELRNTKNKAPFSGSPNIFA